MKDEETREYEIPIGEDMYAVILLTQEEIEMYETLRKENPDLEDVQLAVKFVDML